MTDEQFRWDLAHGRGRAWERVRRARGRGYEREVDRVCLRAAGVDPQIEGSRGEWTYGLAKIAGRVDALRPRMIRAVKRGGDSWTRVQQFEWLAEDARAGSTVSRDTLARLVDREADVALLGQIPEAVVRALGYSGYEAALRRIAENDDPAGVRAFSSAANDVHGTVRGRAWTRRAAAADPAIAAALSEDRRRRAGYVRPPFRRQWFDAVLDGRERLVKEAIRFQSRRASEADLRRIERRLDVESDPRVLERVLYVFHERPLQRGVERALELASSPDPGLSAAALRALGPIADPRAGRILLGRVASGPARDVAPAIRALAFGRVRGAARAIERRLSRGIPRSLAWEVSQAVLLFRDRHRRESLDGAMAWVWDHAPCSMCRKDAIADLARRRRVPPRIRREALHDAHPEVRSIARSSAGRGPRA